MATGSDKERTKQTRLSIEDRVEIIERLENGERATDLAQKYKISKSGITFIKKSKEHLLRQRNLLIKCQGQTSKKRCTGIESTPLEQALYEWFLQKKNMGVSVTAAMLQEKAMELNKMLNGTSNFKGTYSYVTKFKKRHSIGDSTVCADSTDQNASSNFCQELIKYVMDNKIPLDKVYNAKETGLCWKVLPNRTLAANSEYQTPERKSVKNKVTLMVCTNATGSHKLPMFVVGETNNPYCFKDIRSLPVIHMKQTNALIDRQLMLRWYQEVFLKEIERVHSSNNEQCLLLLNNVPSHPLVEEFNSINERCEVINLPSNATSYIQPMDQGIIQKLKRIYKKHFLRVILTAKTWEDVEKLLRSFDILKFYHLINDAWDEVTEIVIRNGWKNIFPSDLKPELDSKLFLNMVKEIPEYNNITLQDINSWLNNEEENQTNNPESTLSNYNENINQTEHLSNSDSIKVATKDALDAIGAFLFWYQNTEQCSLEDRQYLRKFWNLALEELLAKNNT